MIIDRNGLYHYIDFSKINCSFERSNMFRVYKFFKFLIVAASYDIYHSLEYQKYCICDIYVIVRIRLIITIVNVKSINIYVKV